MINPPEFTLVENVIHYISDWYFFHYQIECFPLRWQSLAITKSLLITLRNCFTVSILSVNASSISLLGRCRHQKTFPSFTNNNRRMERPETRRHLWTVSLWLLIVLVSLRHSARQNLLFLYVCDIHQGIYFKLMKNEWWKYKSVSSRTPPVIFIDLTWRSFYFIVKKVYGWYYPIN